MKNKKFRLTKDIKESNYLYKKGYEDDIDYPNWYDKKTGKIGISVPFYGYIWIEKEDYVVINTNPNE